MPHLSRFLPFLWLLLALLSSVDAAAQSRKKFRKKPARTVTRRAAPARRKSPAARVARRPARPEPTRKPVTREAKATPKTAGKIPALKTHNQPVPFAGQLAKSRWVDSVMATLTPDQRVAQLFMVAAYSNRKRIDEDSITTLIQQYGIGGIVFFQGGPVRQSRILNRYQAQSKVPLLVAMDAEWGVGMRLDSVQRFPFQMSLGGIRDNQLMYDMGTEVAAQFKRLGMHVNFAPVVDVNNNAANPVIGFRSWGEDRQSVTEKSYLYMRGMQDANILAVAKHFPGHGDTDVDSHVALPVINSDLARLTNVDLYPFQQSFEVGVMGVMVGHLYMPLFDTLRSVSATISRNLVTGLLKEKMAYKGLVFTDALNMKSVTNLYKPGELDALALLAERYYAESDILDEHNHKASLGRAALYHYRLQRQNEINILRRALSRRPSEKISLRLAALYNEPTDFFDRLATLREGLKATPNSSRLNNDLAHLYSRSTLSDSVNWYLNRAEAADPGNSVIGTNRLAFLLQNRQFAAAAELAQKSPQETDAAWQSNLLLLNQQTPGTKTALPVLPAPDPKANLTVAEFARLYHAALRRAQRQDTTYLPALTQLVQRPSNAAYFEQLTFLRALTQHSGGQPVSARTTLSPLLAGNTPSAGYYQNLEALWLLLQRAYGSAAVGFAAAHRNSYAEAALNRAYALALNNQPDSAQAAIAAILQRPDTALHQSARQLQQALALDYTRQYATASDTLKSQFLVFRGSSIPPADLLVAAESIRTLAARQAALLAQLPRALQAGQLDAAEHTVARFAPPIAPPITQRSVAASEWNVIRIDLLLRQQKVSQLRQLLKTGYFTPLYLPYRLAGQAALANLTKQPKRAQQLYRQLVREAPFVAPGVLAAATFYAGQQDYLAAYGALQAALEYNPESVALLQAYALAAIPAGLGEYAAASLEKLRPLLSPAEYATFRTLYDGRLATQAAAAAPWN